MDFLDNEICEEFRNAINETNIFIEDKEYKEKFNLICVVMDRVHDSITYLNSHSSTPETENSLLSFIMYSCMVLDGIKQLLKTLEIEDIYTDEGNPDAYKYFKTICIESPLSISEEECPTDDKFFEYLRSLSMAHPFETSRPKFFKKNEIQYSPWVIANKSIMQIRNLPDSVGIRIYSNQFEESQDLLFSFNLLKEYLKSRFILMKKATEKVHQIISNKKEEWKKDKVRLDQQPIEILKQVKEILSNRYEETYKIEEAINYLSCNLTDSFNQQAVYEYRKAIIDLFPNIKQALDNIDHIQLDNIIDNVLYMRPKKVHNSCHYELEKIFGYLQIGDEASDNYEWGLQQVENFMENFASKWVRINTKKMNADEIKLLVRVALYLEKQEQEKGK